jgi:GMP synthase-like glutamine amidotransferase
MRIGILETGGPPEELAAIHGDYPAMVARLLGPQHSYERYDVRAGVLPVMADRCAAYVVTGSAAGVNDPYPWIAPLIVLLRAARGRQRLLGICFGHQVIAQAFGGRVEKAPGGWGLGLHRYEMTRPVEAIGTSMAAMASHQDQVVAIADSAEVIASSDFTPHAALAYADGAALTLQCHPEFDADYGRALIAAHRAPDIDEDLRGAAHASLAQPSDNAAIGHWLNGYLASGRID